jgi:mono/diheme cytochrome c family protein
MTKTNSGLTCDEVHLRLDACLKCLSKWLIGGLVILIITGVINLPEGLAQMSSPHQVMTVASNGVGSIPPEARSTAESMFGDRCAVCHGPNGDGKGPGVANLNPKPIDFRDRKWQQSVSDEKITKAIVYGGPAVGLSAEMAANPDLETQPAVVAALVEHIRNLAGKRKK